ncbi:MAG: hypothetical protein P8100_04870 [bacterium]|jgi:hypothetical protein
MKKSLLILFILSFPVFCFPQTEKEAAEKAMKEANNPLANFTAFNIQNYYYAKLAGTDHVANSTWLRFVSPIGKKIILRASVPIPTRIPVNDSLYKSGIGNINVFAAYLVNKASSPATVGIGPLVVAPTITEDLGSTKWQLGAAFVYFNAKSAQVQWGGLVTYQHSVGGKSEDPTTSVAVLQPFYFFQLGKGTYLRGAPLWLFDFENDAYNIPIGLGIGKVVKVNRVVFNIFIEPQFTMYNKGQGIPLFALFGAINMQFAKKK